MVFYMEVSCPKLTRQEKNHQSWNWTKCNLRETTTEPLTQVLSDWGRRPQLWVWKCCSQGFEFSVCFLKNNSLVQWVDCLQPLLGWFWIWKRKLSDICIFSIHRPSVASSKGEKWSINILLEKETDWWGLSLVRTRLLHTNFQGAFGGFARGFCSRFPWYLEGELWCW